MRSHVHFFWASILCTVVLCGGARAEIIADGNAEFSGTQGSNDWYFGYFDRSADMSGGGDGIYDDSKFTPFAGGSHIPSTDPDNEWSYTSWVLDFPPFTEITSTTMNPNNFRGVQHFAVMRWVSDKQGVANVAGAFEKDSRIPSDGTIGRVFRNGEELFAQKTLEAAAPFELMIDDLTIGDTFDFAVDYGTDFGGTSSNDITKYTILVDLLSEGLLGDFDLSGVLDAPDINELTQQSALGTNPAELRSHR